MPSGADPGTGTLGRAPSAKRIACITRERGVRTVTFGAELVRRVVEPESTRRRARGPVKPTNQASVLSLVVPVCPRRGGRVTRRRLAVPRATTALIMS